MRDVYGFEYFKELPEDAKKVESIYEFIEVVPEDFDYYRRKLGQPYLLWNKNRQVFEKYEITPYTQDIQLLPYLNRGELFLLPLQTS